MRDRKTAGHLSPPRIIQFVIGLPNIRAFLTSTPSGICAALDWLVKVAERLLVLGVAFLAFYFGYYFCRASLSKEQKEVVAFVAINWKIILILMIPLFYQTVRTFLEEVQEAWGIKRRPKQALNVGPSEEE